ncbi:PfkB family carbohydrate kinase [Ruminococcaceae bacterium OttesenSCG-928-A11]|nr:PfkB family carbohydrate kinase [Ruminococcaceae bacterium OttesenSCG-928-A11]
MSGAAKWEVLCCGPMGADLVFSGLDGFPAPGREVYGEGFAILPGGSANTMFALHRLGLSTALVCGVGTDEMGGILRRWFEGAGLPTEGFVKSAGTAVSAVLPHAGERGFATWLPAYDWPAIGQRLTACLAHSALLHTSSYNCTHLDIPALCAGVPFTVDSSWHPELTLKGMAPTLAACRAYFTNADELAMLTGEADREKALAMLCGYTETVVLKLGGEGCLIAAGGRQTVVPPCHAGEAVDATGAGDAFCAGFLYGLARGLGPAQCGRLANACGAIAVTRAGGLATGLTIARAFELAGLAG